MKIYINTAKMFTPDNYQYAGSTMQEAAQWVLSSNIFAGKNNTHKGAVDYINWALSSNQAEIR